MVTFLNFAKPPPLNHLHLPKSWGPSLWSVLQSSRNIDYLLNPYASYPLLPHLYLLHPLPLTIGGINDWKAVTFAPALQAT